MQTLPSVLAMQSSQPQDREPAATSDGDRGGVLQSAGHAGAAGGAGVYEAVTTAERRTQAAQTAQAAPAPLHATYNYMRDEPIYGSQADDPPPFEIPQAKKRGPVRGSTGAHSSLGLKLCIRAAQSTSENS